MKGFLTKDRTAALFSVVLIAGATWDKLSVLPTKDPAPYHAHIREVAATMPARFGDWIGEDVFSDGTKDWLHANVMIDRRFKNTVSGEQVSFLFVQCPDIRDLVPHYPAICYPGRGMIQIDVGEHHWIVDGLKITGTEYEFESNSFRQANGLIVDDFMLLPGGLISGDMKLVKKHVPLRNRYYGVAQVQLVFPVGTSQQQRELAFGELVGAYRPLFDAVLSGKVE